MIHLDTNFLVEALRPGTNAQARLVEWLATGESLHVNSMTWAEFLSGPPGGLSPAHEAAARRFLAPIQPLTAGEAELASRLFNATGRRSRTLADCLIAASAIVAQAPLATANEADFKPFASKGLQLLP